MKIELTEDEARTILVSLDAAYGEGAVDIESMRPIGKKIKEIYPEVAKKEWYGHFTE